MSHWVGHDSSDNSVMKRLKIYVYVVIAFSTFCIFTVKKKKRQHDTKHHKMPTQIHRIKSTIFFYKYDNTTIVKNIELCDCENL